MCCQRMVGLGVLTWALGSGLTKRALRLSMLEHRAVATADELCVLLMAARCVVG